MHCTKPKKSSNTCLWCQFAKPLFFFFCFLFCLFVWWGSLEASWRLPAPSAQTAEQALSCAGEARFQPACYAHTEAGCLLPFMMALLCLVDCGLDFYKYYKKPPPTFLISAGFLQLWGGEEAGKQRLHVFKSKKLLLHNLCWLLSDT